MNKITNDEYQSIVYVSHQYGGLKPNEEKVSNVINNLIKQYPDHLFISPIHTFGYAYNVVDYETGLSWCLWLLEKCDEMWVVADEWENSKGCKLEMSYCQEQKIPFKIITTYDVDNTEGNSGI